MKITRAFARRFRLLRLLIVSLVFGALYDLGFAALMVLAPEVPARLFQLPLPGESFYLWIMATFLAMLAGFYLLAAQDPRRYSGIIAIAIGGRFLGAFAFALAAWLDPSLAGLYPLALADFLIGAAHAICWLPLRA
jgi:hypothetical protein